MFKLVRKIILVLLVFSLKTNADIGIHFFASGNAILKSGETSLSMSSVLGAGNLVQLVWSTSNWGYQNNNLDLSLANTGETILDTTTTSFGGSFNAGTSFYTNDDVNGLNINDGYLFARVFESSNPSNGDYFLEMGLLHSSNVVVNSPVYGENYSRSLNDLGDVPIDSQSTIVGIIPEPATVSLIGISFVGLTIYRRKDKLLSKFDVIDFINFKPESREITKWRSR